MKEHKHDYDKVRLCSQGCGKPYKYVRRCRICEYNEELGNGDIEGHEYEKGQLIRSDGDLAVYKSICSKCGKSRYYSEKISTKNYSDIKTENQKIRKIILILGTLFIILFIILFIFFTDKLKVLESKTKEQESDINNITTQTASIIAVETDISKPSASKYLDETTRVYNTETEYSSAYSTATETESYFLPPTVISTETETEAYTVEITAPAIESNTRTETEHMTTAELNNTNNVTDTSVASTTETKTIPKTTTETFTSVYQTTTEETKQIDTETVAQIIIPEPGKLYLGSEIKIYIESGLYIIVVKDIVTEYIFPGQTEIEEGLWPPSDSFLCDVVTIDNKNYYRFTRF